MATQLDALRAYVASRPAARAIAPVASAARDARTGGPWVFVVASGRGGAGTSTVAAMLALACAAGGAPTLLVDADEQVGPQRLLLGVPATDGARGIGDLRDATTSADALLVPVGATLALLPGGGADAAPFAPGERRVALARASAAFARHAAVVLDAGARLDAVHAAAEAARAVAPRATELLVVAGREPVALAASYALVKALGERAPDLPASVVANRAGDDDAAFIVAQLAEGARRFLGRELPLAGALPDDACLDAALRAGMPLPDAAAGSPAAAAVEAMAARLLPMAPRAGLAA